MVQFQATMFKRIDHEIVSGPATNKINLFPIMDLRALVLASDKRVQTIAGRFTSLRPKRRLAVKLRGLFSFTHST